MAAAPAPAPARARNGRQAHLGQGLAKALKRAQRPTFSYLCAGCGGQIFASALRSRRALPARPGAGTRAASAMPAGPYPLPGPSLEAHGSGRHRCGRPARRQIAAQRADSPQAAPFTPGLTGFARRPCAWCPWVLARPGQHQQQPGPKSRATAPLHAQGPLVMARRLGNAGCRWQDAVPRRQPQRDGRCAVGQP